MPVVSKCKITDEGRECSKCLVFKVWDAFGRTGPRSGSRGHSSWCSGCIKKRRVEIGYKSPSAKGWQERFRAERSLMFDHYGRECCWCGESDVSKLELDHVHDDGAAHRAGDPSAVNIARWVIENGFPEGFQILCGKCNTRKAWQAVRRGAAWVAKVEFVKAGISRLPAREQQVLQMRFGIGCEPLRWDDIAKQLENMVTGQPGVTFSTVKEIAGRAMRKLEAETG